MTVLAHHGTDRLDFTRFDIAEARPFNIGLHFGTNNIWVLRFNVVVLDK